MRTIVVALGLVVWCAAGADAQTTLFTTEDYRQDREHWTDPAYYLHNTARELTDMVEEHRFGQKGSGADKYDIQSPYPFTSSWEHYQAWLQKANGGTKHNLATLPNWDGRWTGEDTWLDSVGIQASTIAAALTPQYQEYYLQQAKAEAEGRHWWPASFCLPDGFVRGVWSANEFLVRPNQVVVLNGRFHEIQVRWVFTDGREHPPEALQFSQWQGESIGFWDGDALVIHTNQIRGWNASHSMFEWSDQLTAVERYQRVGNEIVGEVTLYDPVAFRYPLHAKLRFTRADAADRPIYNTCTDTNGPSGNVLIGPDGLLTERTPGDPAYWDPTDPRPWAKQYAIGERRAPSRTRGRQ